MSRKLIALAAVALAATSCAGSRIVVAPGDLPEGTFLLQVVERANDSGPGLSLATDADGNPHLSYLVLPEEAEGEAVAAAPGEPVLPAVKHAHLVGGVWARSAVAQERADLTVEDRTSIAVDGEGTHHIAWTEGAALFYSDDPSGEAEPFAFPTGSAVVEPAVAVDEEGTPWIAFWDTQTSPEGPGALLRLATPAGDDWNVETIAEGAFQADAATIGIGIGPDGPIVAYGNKGRTLLARDTGPLWDSELADPDGGIGVSLAIDGEGNPHLAYLNRAGQVRHAHSINGGPWERSAVGEGGVVSATTIAVDSEGVHHVAWETTGGVAYATNAEGRFEEQGLPAADDATRPRLGIGPDDAVLLAWYDSRDTAVELASRGLDEPLLAAPPGATAPTDGATETPTDGEPACEPSGTELSVVAESIAFDTDCLAAPADTAFTIEFENKDAVPHNVAIYTEQGGQALFTGETFPGPDSRPYQVDPIPAGHLYFQCDVHPNMNGDFVSA